MYSLYRQKFIDKLKKLEYVDFIHPVITDKEFNEYIFPKLEMVVCYKCGKLILIESDNKEIEYNFCSIDCFKSINLYPSVLLDLLKQHKLQNLWYKIVIDKNTIEIIDTFNKNNMMFIYYVLGLPQVKESLKNKCDIIMKADEFNKLTETPSCEKELEQLARKSNKRYKTVIDDYYNVNLIVNYDNLKDF